MSLSSATLAATRFGYGPRAGETPPASAADLMRQLTRAAGTAPRFPEGGIAARKKEIALLSRMRLTFNRSPQGKDERSKTAYRKAYNARLIGMLTLDEHLRFVETVMSPNGFHERLAAFWMNHFAVNSTKTAMLRVLVPLYEAEAIRPAMTGRFADLARRAVLHPAMLLYLDQQRSVGPGSPRGRKAGRGLNENLGRELLELHTLGAGAGYTQDDVRNAALILTGLGIDRITQQTTFRADISEPGERQVFGGRYGGGSRSLADIEDMIEDLAADPRTRDHICRKLVRHFIADSPPGDVVDAMVEAWRDSGGLLQAVYQAMLDHPRSWSEPGAKAKLPFEFIVSSLRALGADEKALMPKPRPFTAAAGGEEMMAGAEPVTAMVPGTDPEPVRYRQVELTVPGSARLGQPLWRAPSPAGFADDMATWITAGQVTERIGWARRAVATFGKGADPRAFVRSTLADSARQDTIDTVARAPNRETGLMLALVSPEFNRR
ncbi:DUF1800 domain-containing protein [Ensifer soli]|uniref:DUF1800 domain-containing protein n=1 Tax=Ciceribacter sp. sgz301302 TaxID=3342379 RepID=UPI0035B9C28D